MFRITCAVLGMFVFLKCSVMAVVSCVELHDIYYYFFFHLPVLVLNYCTLNCFIGTTGIVDYTNYDDMKYAVSCPLYPSLLP